MSDSQGAWSWNSLNVSGTQKFNYIYKFIFKLSYKYYLHRLEFLYF